MYKVVSIDSDEMTKSIKIKNLQTGTVDTCFDDSALVSDMNFDFMSEGNENDCKIKLFGNVVQAMQENAVLCKIINLNITVGTRRMVEVLISDDEYYIPEKKISNLLNTKEIYSDKSSIRSENFNINLLLLNIWQQHIYCEILCRDKYKHNREEHTEAKTKFTNKYTDIAKKQYTNRYR